MWRIGIGRNIIKTRRMVYHHAPASKGAYRGRGLHYRVPSTLSARYHGSPTKPAEFPIRATRGIQSCFFLPVNKPLHRKHLQL